MPFPFLNFRSELDPTTRKELDEMAANLTEWLSKEHHSDGTHAAITADSIDVTGDLDVHGHTGFEDLSGNSIIANDITVATLNVQGTLDLSTGGTTVIGPILLQSGAGSVVSTEKIHSLTQDFLGVNVWTIETGAVGVGGQITLTRTADGARGLFAGGGTLIVGSAALAGDLEVAGPGTFLINTNKFTVDGATGRLKLASFIGPAADGMSLQIVNAAASAAIAVFDTTNNRVGFGNILPGATLDVGNNFTVAGATGNMFTAGTLRAQGAIRFDSLTSGFLNTDGSGNVSATAGVPLVQNGVNFGPFPVASITVVNGQITNIS